jgi:hypothetical protein
MHHRKPAEGCKAKINPSRHPVGIINMGIGKEGHFLLQVLKIVFTFWHCYKFLETDDVRILLMDIIENFTPDSRIFFPLVVIKQAYIVGKKPYLLFLELGFLYFRLKLEVFPENVPANGDCSKRYQNIPFPEGTPEQNKEYIDNEDERITHPDKGKYPVSGGTDINR